MPEKGDLINPHNYLDLLFRLLHEDAISELRDGILLFLKMGKKRLNKEEIKSEIKCSQIRH